MFKISLWLFHVSFVFIYKKIIIKKKKNTCSCTFVVHTPLGREDYACVFCSCLWWLGSPRFRICPSPGVSPPAQAVGRAGGAGRIPQGRECLELWWWNAAPSTGHCECRREGERERRSIMELLTGTNKKKLLTLTKTFQYRLMHTLADDSIILLFTPNTLSAGTLC